MEIHNFEEEVLYDSRRNKELVRKLDWRIVPWIAILYLLSFLDRVNIGKAYFAFR
jgi:hypothetical protein